MQAAQAINPRAVSNLQTMRSHVRDSIVHADDVELHIAHEINHVHSAQAHVADAMGHVQGARAHIANAISNVKEALDRMPAVERAAQRPLPSTRLEITRYVCDLLTPEEHRICDMATD